MNKLSYKDDEDRSYGAAGMAIGLVVYRGHDMIASISLDREPAHLLELSDEFYYGSPQEVSAKASWNSLLDKYNYSIVMLISNLLCRSLTAHDTEPDNEAKQQLHDAAVEEGRQECQLEADEVEPLFSSRYNHLHQVFSHYGVNAIAHNLASAIVANRELSRMEILDYLEQLRSL